MVRLFNAAIDGNNHVTRLILRTQKKFGPDDDLREDGATPLFAASQNGHLEVVQTLLRYKANPNAMLKTTGATPLYAACQEGHFGLVKYLFANGAIEPSTEDGSTCLHVACYQGHAPIVEWLLQRHVDVNRPRKDGATALHHAVNQGRDDIVRILLRYGADTSVLMKDGKTALMIASQGGHYVCVQLLTHPMEINKQADDGSSALHYAVEADNPEIVTWLTDHGIDPTLERLDGTQAHQLSKSESVTKAIEKSTWALEQAIIRLEGEALTLAEDLKVKEKKIEKIKERYRKEQKKLSQRTQERDELAEDVKKADLLTQQEREEKDKIDKQRRELQMVIATERLMANKLKNDIEEITNQYNTLSTQELSLRQDMLSATEFNAKAQQKILELEESRKKLTAKLMMKGTEYLQVSRNLEVTKDEFARHTIASQQHAHQLSSHFEDVLLNAYKAIERVESALLDPPSLLSIDFDDVTVFTESVFVTPFGEGMRGVWRSVEVAVREGDLIEVPGDDEHGSIITKMINNQLTDIARVRHPNILPLFGASCEPCEGVIQVVMEVPYVVLRQLLQCLREDDISLTWYEKLRLCCGLTAAVSYLHAMMPRPVIHGSISVMCATVTPQLTLLLGDTEGAALAPFCKDRVVFETSFCPEDLTAELSRPTIESDCFAVGVVLAQIISITPTLPRANYRGAMLGTLLDHDDARETLRLCMDENPHNRPIVKNVHALFNNMKQEIIDGKSDPEKQEEATFRVPIVRADRVYLVNPKEAGVVKPKAAAESVDEASTVFPNIFQKNPFSRLSRQNSMLNKQPSFVGKPSLASQPSVQ